MDQQLISRFDSFCNRFNVSVNKAARAIGYTAGVLSQWRKGEYKGKVDEVEAKVRAWLDLQEAREESGAVPFVPLRRTARIKTAVRIAHEERFIGLVLGNSGAGKSRGLTEYKAENPSTTILVTCDPTMGLSTVVTLLARELGLDTKGRLSEISDRLVSELIRRDMCVIFDEADYLSDSVIEWARIALNDKGGAALVFGALPRFEYRIKNNKADHRQLENRIGMRLHVEDVDDADVKDVVKAVWPEIDDEVQKVFVQAARQSLHLLVRHICLVQRALRQGEQELPSAELAGESARFLVR